MNLKISQTEKQQILEMHKSRMGDVKPLISEQSAVPGGDIQVQSLPQEFQTFVKQYGLTGTFNETGQSSSGEYGYNKGNVLNGFNTSEIKTYEEHKGDYQKCIERSKEYETMYDTLIKGTQTSNNMDPRMAEYCENRPQDPRCRQNASGKPMDKRSAEMEADNQINQKYPNMGYCGVVIKMQKIVNNK